MVEGQSRRSSEAASRSLRWALPVRTPRPRQPADKPRCSPQGRAALSRGAAVRASPKRLQRSRDRLAIVRTKQYYERWTGSRANPLALLVPTIVTSVELLDTDRHATGSWWSGHPTTTAREPVEQLSAFCWSKFGTEAGEPVDSILQRKEEEREANEGTFLWGIGNSIRPSLLALLDMTQTPDVLFTPMVATPSLSDIAPTSRVLWRSAAGLDGISYVLPRHSLVTSKGGPGIGRKRHYALVCRFHMALGAADEEAWIDQSELRNLRTGTVVGSSQVTSVVTRVARLQPAGPRYKVAFRAVLEYPYLVVLSDPVPLPDSLRLDHAQGGDREAVLEELHKIKAECGPAKP